VTGCDSILKDQGRGLDLKHMDTGSWLSRLSTVGSIHLYEPLNRAAPEVNIVFFPQPVIRTRYENALRAYLGTMSIVDAVEPPKCEEEGTIPNFGVSVFRSISGANLKSWLVRAF
jgi:hypothetical protein